MLLGGAAVAPVGGLVTGGATLVATWVAGVVGAACDAVVVVAVAVVAVDWVVGARSAIEGGGGIETPCWVGWVAASTAAFGLGASLVTERTMSTPATSAMTAPIPMNKPLFDFLMGTYSPESAA